MAPRSTGTVEVAPSVSGTPSRSRAAAVGYHRRPRRSPGVDREGQRRGCLGSGSRNYHLQSMYTNMIGYCGLKLDMITNGSIRQSLNGTGSGTKLACMTLCGSFYTSTSAVPGLVPIFCY